MSLSGDIRLFSTSERTRTGGRRFNEPAYSFLNSSAWPSVHSVREFWEGWVSQYDHTKKPGLAARFQSYDNHPHLSAFLELFTFAVLKRCGYEIEIEPPCGSLALDFFTSMPKRDLKFYAECTATGRREAEAGADARAADLLEAIDKVPTGRFLLQVELQKRGSQAPSIRLLREGLTSWLASLDHLAAIDEFREANRVSEWTWTERDWRIKFAALPAEAQPEEDEGALGIIGPHDLDMTQHLRLRRALDIKASGYGTLDHPLLVVANSTEYQRERDLMIALLGDVVWDVDLRRSHASERFLLNGVFGSPAKPRNVVLSAAMHGHFDALNFTLPDRTFSLTHHPFARHPLPRKLFPFCKERYFESETGQMVIIEPKVTVTEFFGLPKDWPGFDRDPR